MKKILLSKGFADELRRVVAEAGEDERLPAVLHDVECALISLDGEVYPPVELGHPRYDANGIRIPARIVERHDHVSHDHFATVEDLLVFLRQACGLARVGGLA
jgi:hypothetical protein